jgi:hypothetical protein
VLVVSVVAVTIALASSMLVMGNTLVQNASERSAIVDDAALSGLEEARNRLNARLDSVPVSGYGTIENGVLVPNTNGIRRSTWVARIGNSDSLANAGEYGVQAEIVSQATDAAGTTAVRRSLVYQTSFARYAFFADQGRLWDGTILRFANGWTASGPMHINEQITIATGTFPQAIFRDVVTTATGVQNAAGAQWGKGPARIVAPVTMPSTADLNIVRNIAMRAGYLFTPSLTVGDSANVTIRIEFVAVDADGDGNTTGPDDGFFRVYRLRNTTRGEGYVGARTPTPPSGAVEPLDSLLYSWNCGVVNGGRNQIPQLLAEIPILPSGDYRSRMTDRQNAFDHTNARCLLGGDPLLTDDGLFVASDPAGDWLPRTVGTVPPAVAARADGAFLWPLSARFNPDFRGSIFVNGRVGVSGTVRGRVTLASPNNIVVLDDLRQATSPATTTGSCSADDDMVGLFAGENVLWVDNSLQTPQQRRTNTNGGWLRPRKDFSTSTNRPDLTVHAVTLALRSIATERPRPRTSLQDDYVFRGFVRQIGGRIQARGGQGGTVSGGVLHGYSSDISHNHCAMSFPPPYFPTTGHWTLSQFYELDPQTFTPASWFAR